MKTIRTMIERHGIPADLPVKQMEEGLVFVDTISSFKRVEGYTDKVNDVLKHPFKLDYFCIFVCTEGKLVYMSDMQTYNHGKGSCLVLPPNSIGRIVSYTDDVKIIGIACGRDFYPTELAGVDSDLSIEILKEPLFRMSDDDVNLMVSSMRLIADMYRAGTVPGQIIKGQLATLYNLLIHIFKSGQHSWNTREGLMVRQFFSLLSSYVKSERRLSFYAEKLCVTPKHLSMVLRRATGLSAAGWIRERIIQEAKILLLFDKYPVWQVSEILGFPNESFFGTYFKKATGNTPAEYARVNLNRKLNRDTCFRRIHRFSPECQDECKHRSG